MAYTGSVRRSVWLTVLVISERPAIILDTPNVPKTERAGVLIKKEEHSESNTFVKAVRGGDIGRCGYYGNHAPDCQSEGNIPLATNARFALE